MLISKEKLNLRKFVMEDVDHCYAALVTVLERLSCVFFISQNLSKINYNGGNLYAVTERYEEALVHLK